MCVKNTFQSVTDRNLSRYVLVFALLVGYCHFTTLFWVLNRYEHDKAVFQQTNPDAPLPHWLSTRLRVFTHYCYFVMTTISTNGYGDISPNKDSTVSEMLFAMFLMLIGVMLMSGVIALSNNFINELSMSWQKHKQKMKDFDHWFRVLQRKSRANFPARFVSRVQRFFGFLLTSEFNNTLYNGDFFLQLPDKLGNELELEYAQRHEKVFDGLFSKFSEPFCIKIIKESQALCWMQGDTLIRRGDFLLGLYFVAKGKIQVSYLDPKNVARIYRKGSSFGWSCLNDKPSHFSFKALELTLTLFIPVDTLEAILEEFPGDYGQLMKMSSQEESGLKSEKIFLKSLISSRGVQGHQQLLSLAETLDKDDDGITAVQSPVNTNRQRRQSVYVDKTTGTPVVQGRGRRSSVMMTSPVNVVRNSEMVSGIAIARLILGSAGDSIIQGIEGLLKSAGTPKDAGPRPGLFALEAEAQMSRGSSQHTAVVDTSSSQLDLSKFRNALDDASQKARVMEDSFELDEGPLSENILDGLDFGSVLQASEKCRDYYEKLMEQSKKYGHRDGDADKVCDSHADEQTQPNEEDLDRSILMTRAEVSVRLGESHNCSAFFGSRSVEKILDSKIAHLQRRWRVFEAVSKLQLHKQLLKLRFCQDEQLDMSSLGGALQLINQQEQQLKVDLEQHLGMTDTDYLFEIQKLVQW